MRRAGWGLHNEMSRKKSKKKQAKSPESSQDLFERYRKLEPHERAFVQLLSVAYEPISGANALAALKQANVLAGNGKPFDSPSYRETVGKLNDAGLVEITRATQPRCNPQIAEVATRDAILEGAFPRMVEAVEIIRPLPRSIMYTYYQSFHHAVRDFRIYFYRGDADDAYRILNRIYSSFSWERQAHDPMLAVANAPFDAAWLAKAPYATAERVLHVRLVDAAHRLEAADDFYDYLRDHWNDYKTKEYPNALPLLLAEQAMWRGALRDLEPLLAKSPFINATYYLGAQALFDGDLEACHRLFAEGLSGAREVTGKRSIEIPGSLGILYALALIQTGDRKQLEAARRFLRRRLRSECRAGATPALLCFVEELLGNAAAQNDDSLTYVILDTHPPLETIVIHLVLFWRDDPHATTPLVTLTRMFDKAAGSGYHWLAAELASAILLVKPDDKKAAQFAGDFYRRTGMRPLSSLIQKQEAWERSLDALALVADGKISPPGEAETRLAWYVGINDSYCNVEAREVKRKGDGRWTKGKVVSPKRLGTEPEKLPYLTQQDREACSHITVEVVRNRYYRPKTYHTFTSRVVLGLAGHPLVFRPDGTPLEVAKGEPELRVARKGKRVQISLWPSTPTDSDVCVVPETAGRIKVVEYSAAHRRIAGIIGSGLEIPSEHESRVLKTLSSVASLITIHSDIGGGLENVPTVPADSQPRVVLVPSGNGLRAQIMTQPLTGGAYYRPGYGGATVMAEVHGQRVQTTRDLRLERDRAAHVLAACATLERAQEIDGEWYLNDPVDCLELLCDLRELGGDAVVEWPKGEKMTLTQTATFANLRFRLNGERDWFEACGDLRLDDGRVMDLRQLIELLEEAPGRFVPLGDGEFLALTKEFRKRLDEFSSVAETRGKGFRVHPLAAPSIEGLIENAGEFNADDVWKKHIARFREAETIECAVPSTLRATLRDYQAEGFHWLTRLDHWGAGACLADDMGLGKTVQALAFILAKASEGPALVVAPTSVCMNWMEEVQRFAPSLNPILFGPGDRQAVLDALQPMDVVVCSYGLLYQEEEKLAARHWRVAVLDEAQAIKNVATRRSKAAMHLQAGFRLITTGTPIENHLGELWNLFCFINRGLLGSLEQFNQRFANPIERYQNREARIRLKRIIQPFMLRRVKEQVLEELPARTEILLHVELNDEEAAFYEALRRKAIDQLANTNGNAGQKHLRILAEIMRLRRACCNAQLVTPEMAIPSSKLSVFLDLVDELIENRHKALVFSQFVDHLAILRKALDEKKVAYQYLDGSTPQRERKRRVDAFQSGDGDLFLISLKAGGTGLNLTAADYVIHMDPWWNPAVEDQASDRAHRIGQLRPVTIYRLVTKGTIESKIVELHNQKRDLADSLLEGTEMTGKMSADELLALLQESL